MGNMEEVPVTSTHETTSLFVYILGDTQLL